MIIQLTLGTALWKNATYYEANFSEQCIINLDIKVKIYNTNKQQTQRWHHDRQELYLF